MYVCMYVIIILLYIENISLICAYINNNMQSNYCIYIGMPCAIILLLIHTLVIYCYCNKEDTYVIHMCINTCLQALKCAIDRD